MKRHHLRRPAAGAAPGTLDLDPDLPAPVLVVVGLEPDAYVEERVATPEDVRPYLSRWKTVWVHVEGLGDEAVLRQLAELFSIHPVALEDIAHLHMNASASMFPWFSLLVGHVWRPDAAPAQISLVLGGHYVISFQERPGPDPFEPVRRRLREGRSRLSHPDYLFYALVDALVDAWYAPVEAVGERLEALESRLLDQPPRSAIDELYALKREILGIHRMVWPLGDAIDDLLRGHENVLLADDVRVYLRDCRAHCDHLLRQLQSYRDIESGLAELYVSSLSLRVNEVMKVLTVFASVFLPLGFIASCYGMNFRPEASPWNMPELGWTFGYPFALALMALTVAVTLAWFRARRWF